MLWCVTGVQCVYCGMMVSVWYVKGVKRGGGGILWMGYMIC